MGLLEAWHKWDSDSIPYILEDDAKVLVKDPWGKNRVILDIPADRLVYKREDKHLHLGLLPTPFMGDMLNASVYVLMLNTGLWLDQKSDEGDYKWDKKPSYREAVLASLKQERLDGVLPFLFLDTKFAGHAGFYHWHRKCGLEKLIRELARKRGVSTEEARSELGSKLAVIQLVPYHSASFNEEWLNRLPSVNLAGEFVRETVTKRVRAKKSIVIAMRGLRNWRKYLPEDLTEEDGVIRYDPKRFARSTSLNPHAEKSPGGRAILRHLLGVDP